MVTTYLPVTPIIEGVKTIPFVPRKGERYLSINLAIVDLSDALDVARNLGFKPELVQIAHRSGTEIHALLHYEQTDGETMKRNLILDSKIEELADRIDDQAIRHVYSGQIQRL